MAGGHKIGESEVEQPSGQRLELISERTAPNMKCSPTRSGR